MSLSLWISLVTACLIISLTPGAGAINTMSNSLTVGWRRSGWGVLGQQLALITHVLIVAAGVGIVVQRSPVLFEIIRYAGAAYLAYLGVRMILSKPASDPEIDVEEPVAVRESRWSIINRGFWVNMLNPKAIVFFLAFMPQFILPSEPLFEQYLWFIVTAVVVDIIVMWGFFAVAAKPFAQFSKTPRGTRTMNIIFGTLFIFVAGLLLFMR